jgi:hypothetical protein
MHASYIIAMTIPDVNGDDGCHRGIEAKNFVACVSDKRRRVIGTGLRVGVSRHCRVCVGSKSKADDVMFTQ